MDVNVITVIASAATALIGAIGGVVASTRTSKAAAEEQALRHADALEAAKKERERSVIQAQNEARTQAAQASEQLFQHLRVFIADLQKTNTDLVAAHERERGVFRAEMDAERGRCDKQLEAMRADLDSMNKEVDAANERWRKTDRLSLEQESKIHDLEVSLIRERRLSSQEHHPGRRATDQPQATPPA